MYQLKLTQIVKNFDKTANEERSAIESCIQIGLSFLSVVFGLFVRSRNQKAFLHYLRQILCLD